jgi:hypothetical protein
MASAGVGASRLHQWVRTAATAAEDRWKGEQPRRVHADVVPFVLARIAPGRSKQVSVTAAGLVPRARKPRTRKQLADHKDAAAGTRGQLPPPDA